MSIAAGRYIAATVVALLLCYLAAGNAAPSEAGNGATAAFDPPTLELLDDQSGTISVSVTKTLTGDEADNGVVNLELIMTSSPTDTVIASQSATVPAGSTEGQVVTVTATFKVNCNDGVVQGADGSTGEADVDLLIQFPDTFFDTDASGSGTVTCIGVANVEFDPDPLEIEEGDEEKLTVTFTKYESKDEADNSRVLVRLMLAGTDTLIDDKEVKLPGQQRIGKKITRVTSFQLKCENDVIIGLKGSTGMATAMVSVEFTEEGEQSGLGTVKCIPAKTSAVPSGGSHPSDVFVDEETGLAYALNAFDGAIGVFDGDQQVDTLQLPCPYMPAGASSAEPGGFNCVYQSMRLHYFAQQVGFAIYAADFQAALIVVMFFGQTSSIAGTPDTITSIPVGDSPSDIAYDPLHDRLYVANSGDGTVSVINPDPGVVEDTIATGGSPGQIAIDGINGFAYVTDFTGDQVFVIDTSTNTVIDTLPAGDGPDGIVLDPDTGDLYVTNYIDDTLSIMSEATRVPASLPTTVPTGNGPIEVDVNPLTDRIFVANGIDDTVTVIDRSTRMVAATIPVGLTPDDVTVDREDGLVYVANHDVNTLTLIENPSPFSERLWGDLNCDGVIDVADALVGLRLIGSIFEFNGDNCPAPGNTVIVLPPEYGAQTWADLNCDTELDALDPLRLLLFLTGFASAPTAGPGCPSVDEPVEVW